MRRPHTHTLTRTHTHYEAPRENRKLDSSWRPLPHFFHKNIYLMVQRSPRSSPILTRILLSLTHTQLYPTFTLILLSLTHLLLTHTQLWPTLSLLLLLLTHLLDNNHLPLTRARSRWHQTKVYSSRTSIKYGDSKHANFRPLRRWRNT